MPEKFSPFVVDLKKMERGEFPTINLLFRSSASRFPQKNFLTCFDPSEVHFTYAQTEILVKKIASFLVGKGIKKGDPIILTGKNSPEWAIAYLAILYCGAVIVPLDFQMDPITMEALSTFVDAKAAFIDKELYSSLGLSNPNLLARLSLDSSCDNYIGDVDAEIVALPEVHSEDIAAILFTSGTTGNEKGVILTHKNFTSDVYSASESGFLTFTSDDIWYALMPLYHSYTMTAVFLEALSHGCEIVFGKRMVVTQILSDLKQGKITLLLGIPMLFNKLLGGIMRQVKERGPVSYGLVRYLMTLSGFLKKTTKINFGKKIFGFLLRKASLENIRVCICGGGPLTPETFQKFNELGLNFVQGYGLTETAPILTLNPIKKFKVKSVGKVLPWIDMKIIDPDKQGIGEVAVKGPNVTQGYFKAPEATKALFDKDGYLLTGDTGYLDRENYLFLTGRKKFIIVTEGGKNVFPEEIEDKFQLSPEVEQVLVRGYLLKKETLSEGVEVFIYPNKEMFMGKSEKETEDFFNDLIRNVNVKLPVYKQISRTTILDEPMPMTTTKKIRRALFDQQHPR